MRKAWVVFGVMMMFGCGNGTPPPPPTETATTQASIATATASAHSPRPTAQIPPDLPPESAEYAADLPSWEAKLAANKRYLAALAPGGEADFTLLVTGVSQMMADSALNGRVSEPFQAAKPLLDAAIAVYMVWIRTNQFPTDFDTRVKAALEAGKNAPHMGLWEPYTKGKAPHDWTALALWLHRDSAPHVRELLAARADPNPVAVWMAHEKPPYRPYLATEVAALEWLAKLDTLTPAEEQRLKEARLEAAIVHVEIGTLLGDYKANEVRADTLYKAKPVETTGVIGDIKKDITGAVYVTVGTGQPYELQHLQCFFAKAHEGDVLSLSKGDKVTVRGLVDGMVLTNVIAKLCEVRK